MNSSHLHVTARKASAQGSTTDSTDDDDDDATIYFPA